MLPFDIPRRRAAQQEQFLVPQNVPLNLISGQVDRLVRDVHLRRQDRPVERVRTAVLGVAPGDVLGHP